MNMSKFSKLDGQDVVIESTLNDMTPVEEGLSVGGWAALLIVAANLIGVGVGVYKEDRLKKSEEVFNKLFSINEISDYVKKECDEILKEQQKADPSVTQNLPSGFMNWIKKNLTDKNISSFDKENNDNLIKTKVGTYNIYAVGSFTNIGKVVVMLYSKDRNDFFTQIIPLPPKELIKKVKEKYM